MLQVEIYVSSLTKYVVGNENGQWITLPQNEESLRMQLENIFKEEWIILDYTSPFNIGEYENIINLNEKVNQLNDLGLDKEQLTVLFKAGDNKNETFQKIVDGDYVLEFVTTDGSDGLTQMKDDEWFAMQLYDNGFLFWFPEVPEELYDHIDWEGVWRWCENTYSWQEVVYEDDGKYNTWLVNIG